MFKKIICGSQHLIVGIIFLLASAVPVWAATFTVTNTNDSGPGSLRQAILDANANLGTDTIEFNIPTGDSGYDNITDTWSIQPTSELPTITDPVIIDGYTQPGASPNTNPPGLGTNAMLKIELDGSKATAGADGLHITAGSSTVRGLVINRFVGHGIRLETNGGNVIEGNFIGTDVTGTADLGNSRHGVAVDFSPDNTIGGTVPEARNIISGNEAFGVAIRFGSTENFVQGNFIGTDVTGTVDLGNTLVGVGTSASNTTIGGTAAGARNVISSNGAAGVQLSGVGSGVTGSVVQGNFIGTDVTGTVELGNTGFGVSIFDNGNTMIGGTTAGAGNVISGNNATGIHIGGAQETVVQGNFVGTDVTGTIALGNSGPGVHITRFITGSGNVFNASDNTIGGTTARASNVISANNSAGVLISSSSSTGNLVQGNSIFSNGGLGIDLGGDGVTLNDPGDADTGPNNLQNFPVLTSALSNGSTTIEGTLNSTPNTEFRLEFFSNTACDPSDHGEGENFLGSTMVTTDGSGDASFMVSLPPASDQFITATATDSDGNTSEFSECIELIRLDHFLSYKVKRTKGTPKFEKQEVTLTDQFESDVLFEVKKSKELYNPADKNGEGIIDPDTHLVGYEIKRAKGEPKHEKQTNIQVDNQFGTIFVDTKKPDRLLVPSLKDLDIPIPDNDVPDEFPVDHFKCYKVKVKKKICEDDPAIKCREDADCQTGTCNLGFPKGIQASVVDQFNQQKLYDIKKPKRLCNPADKNGEGIINPDAHLMCYKVKPAENEPKHIKVTGIHVNNQFGPEQLDTKKEAELCVPSTKTLP